MIKVTRLNGQELYVNAELVEFIEATPDTVLTLTTGAKLVLKDQVGDLVSRIIEYRKTVGTKVLYRIEPESGNGNCTNEGETV